MPKNKDNIIENARKVIRIEKDSITMLEKRFGNESFKKNFKNAVDAIFNCKGKVIVTAIGKSGIIAQKIVATFNSTGTYSIFLHSADSLHGDIGMLKKNDLVLFISKSGNIKEVKELIQNFKRMNITIIAMVGNLKSDLASVSDIVLDVSVKEEACPHNLAPTSSTTSALVLGDALAISLLQKREFSKKNFAQFHPGGIIGKKLLLTVNDLMVKGDSIPVVDQDSSVKDVIYQISSKRLGCTCVVRNKKLTGIITDGDIRRILEKDLENFQSLKASDIMNSKPKTISGKMLAIEALEFMEENKITQLIVAGKNKIPTGVIHIHRLVEEGL
jgi:arabinose-5-phosphate isomerase